MFDPALKAKGDQGEADLRAWFDRHGFGYVAVCQNRETFASLFNGVVKRPDFLVLVDSIGIIAVDAKHRNTNPRGDAYTLPHETEFQRALMFERIFRMPIWYAYRGSDADTWYWISALKAFAVGKRLGADNSYLQIDLAEFVCLRSGNDFGKLYTQRMPGFERLRAADTTAD